MHQTSFPIENDTPQDACETRISQNAYYADAFICALCMHSDAVSNAIFALRMKRMHQTSFPIENDTQQGVCDPSSSQNAYYANACILALTMHSIVINNAIFS